MRTSYIGYKRSEEIVKFATNNKPESVFIHLFLEPGELSRASSEKCSIFFHRIRIAISSHEISQSISETGSCHREECCERENIPLLCDKKTTNQNHEIHTRNYHAYKWKGFYHGNDEQYNIIPLSPRLDLNSHPINHCPHNIWTEQREEPDDNHGSQEDDMQSSDNVADEAFEIFTIHIHEYR